MHKSKTEEIKEDPPSTIESVDKQMAAMDPNFRYRWCGGGPCGCMGCANVAGGMRNKKDWDSWVERHPAPKESQ